MTTVPTWALWVLGFGSPVLTGVVAAVGVWLTRKASKETRMSAMESEARHEREETMRMFRWAAEEAMSSDPRAAQMGADTLKALATSDVLQTGDRQLIITITSGILARGVSEYSASDEDTIVDIAEPGRGLE